MNKDEMIEDMKIVINQSVVRSNSGLDLSRGLMALSLDKLGYRKVGDDEIVVKKSELARLKNLEINYEQVYEDYRKLEQERKSYREEAKEAAFNEGFDAGKNAVAQYYLDVAYHRIRELKEDIDSAVKAIEDIAKEDGIELED